MLMVPLGHAASAEAPTDIAGDAQTQALDCAGRAVSISGSRNRVTLRGSCPSLSLRGDMNDVTIALAAGAALDIQGTGNTVRTSLAAGAPPAITVIGSSTQLTAAGTDAGGDDAAGPVTLTGDRQSVVADCTGQKVTILANHGRYVLRGGCAGLAANGDGNDIVATLQSGAPVTVEGNVTTLTYSLVGSGAAALPVVRGANSQAVLVEGNAAVAAPAVVLPPTPPTAPPSPAPAASAPARAAVAPATETVPELVQHLTAKIVPAGTLVTLPSQELFAAAGDAVTPAAETRLGLLAQLYGQIHPAGLKVSATDADSALALRRARAVAASIQAHGVTAVPVLAGTTGAAQVEVLIRR